MTDAQRRQAAVSWYVLLSSGRATPADRLRWHRWLEDHPDHRLAWSRIESMRTTLRQVPAALALPALRLARAAPVLRN